LWAGLGAVGPTPLLQLHHSQQEEQACCLLLVYNYSLVSRWSPSNHQIWDSQLGFCLSLIVATSFLSAGIPSAATRLPRFYLGV